MTDAFQQKNVGFSGFTNAGPPWNGPLTVRDTYDWDFIPAGGTILLGLFKG
ncbi:MAG TPA: hypothetical protein VGJ26_00945 [Pirellulales bacterium]|jgi:hypothetical protein